MAFLVLATACWVIRLTIASLDMAGGEFFSSVDIGWIFFFDFGLGLGLAASLTQSFVICSKSFCPFDWLAPIVVG